MPEQTFPKDALISITFISKDSNIPKLKDEYSIPLTSNSSYLESLLKSQLVIFNSDDHFDFLINGTVLISSLEDYINENNLNIENVIEIEFIKKISSPEPKLSILHDDWVSSIQTIGNFLDGIYFLTGCYNGSFGIWNFDQNTNTAIHKVSKIVHEGPIKCLKSYGVNKQSIQFLTASHDYTIKKWKLECQNVSKKKKNNLNPTWMLQCLSVGHGHDDSVESISIQPNLDSNNENSGLFCSGSWDRMIKIWQLSPKEDEKIDSSSDNNASILSKKDKKIQTPIFTFNQHDDVVTTLEWMSSTEICSGSYDNRLRIWDTEAQKTKITLTGQKPILSLSYNSKSELIITGSTDSHVRLWDPRSNVGTIVKSIYSSHKTWVSCVKWSPLDEHLFTSGSYDGLVKIWDSRNVTAPLYDLFGQKEKVLCNDWTLQNLVVNGGTDKTIQIFQL